MVFIIFDRIAKRKSILDISYRLFINNNRIFLFNNNIITKQNIDIKKFNLAKTINIKLNILSND